MDIAVGTVDTCALSEDSHILCWGHEWGNDGQQVTGESRNSYVAVTAGGGYACGIRDDAAIECWGDNTGGQTDVPGGSFVAVDAANSISRGNGYACAIREAARSRAGAMADETHSGCRRVA